MAVSPAMQWALANGLSEADVYKNINDFLATNPDAATTQAQMAQYGISPEDVAVATGGKSGGLLSGNIMAGASWNSTNTALQNALTEATGQQTANYAVGGSTTADTLNQLNTFLAGGGQFDPNATVYLQAGGVDFITGVDKGVVKDNLNQIVKTLGDQGVNVVLTGSPYAKSVDDVINNNFDPKVDQIFNDVAKANSNVALVGTQGEILQNKKLLVDALHTNAEGTAIYNQSVIDALSQFKNEVPSSTPQAIAQVQKTNTVATTPPVITQAASSPVVAQTLATETVDSLIKAGNLNPTQIAAATGVPVGEIVTKAAALAPFQGSTKLGDTYVSPNYSYTQSGEETIVGGLESIGTSKVSSEQGSRTELYSPTGELTNVGKYDKGPSFFGGLADAFNDPVVQAAFLGLGGGGALGNALGLTGSTAQAVGTGLFKGGAAAAGGADLSDALKVGLLSGGLVYGGNELANAIKYQDVPVDFTNMTQDQINDALDVNFANDLARTGMSDAQIKSFLSNPASVYDATQAVTTPTAVSTPVTDGGTVAVTAPTTPSLSNVLSTIASTTPTVNVTAPKATQQVDQAVLDLVNSQLATNVATPANVQVTAQKPVTNQDIVNSIVASLPTTTPTTTPVAQQTITAQKPVTTQDIVNAIVASTPAVTTPVTKPTQTITAQKPVTNQDIVNAIAATVPTTAITQPVAQQTITAQKPATVQEVVNAITATLPTVTPTQAATIAEQVVTSNKPVTTQEVINAITAALPTTTAVTTSTVPTQTITAQKPITTQDVVNAIVATVPTTPTTVPTTTITAQKPSSITDAVTAATIPLIQPSTPLTPTQVTAEKPLSDSDKIRLAQVGLTAAGLLGAGAAASSGSNGTQFPIVPIPESWGNPPKTGVAPFTQLPPINFGDRNLLRGTQWEKFLDPNYGKVPQPVQYSQPSNLSYNDLMGILGSKQGMPPASSLSINDIISGIQNQYGQASRSTMG